MSWVVHSWRVVVDEVEGVKNVCPEVPQSRDTAIIFASNSSPSLARQNGHVASSTFLGRESRGKEARRDLCFRDADFRLRCCS